MVTLVELELNNFKTYLSNHIIKINGKFTVVTGPNGAGKSNIMDAIAFAMGVKTRDLRVSRVEELCHSCMHGGHGMHVKVVIRSENGDEHCFKRSVVGSNCHYHINDNEVAFHHYEGTLKNFNIYARVKNFLVFQDSIESIIMKKPNERTMIFEELSDSGVFKPEYDRLKEQLLQHEKEHQILLSNKRIFTKQIRDLQLYRLETKKYEKLSRQNETALLRLLLFNLYHVRRIIETFVTDEKTLKQTIGELDKKKYAKEHKLGKLLAKCENAEEESSKTEENCKPKECEAKKITDELVKIRAEREYLEKRVGKCVKSYESAKKANDAQKSNIRDLEEALEKVQREKDKYVQQSSETLGRDVELSESQIKEYENLKLSVCTACTADNRLLGLDRNYEILKAIYESECRKLNEEGDGIKRKRKRRADFMRRVEILEDTVRKVQENIRTKRASYDQLMAKFVNSSQEEENLKREIDKINEEIGDIDDDEFGKRKIEDIVQLLRSQFSGVYKRLRDLCEPIHTRYSIAVTKVFGMNADAIIVDEAKTAIECIKYLKNNQIGVCTFLPLDGLGECRLSEHLRDIKDPPNVKLVYDVVKFAPPEIAKAVFYATGNALVCDTPEDASRVAYQRPKRHNCVSLNGCYYRESGIISGGEVDLARKAKRWDLQKKQSLKEKKKDLTSKLREILKSTPKQHDLSLLATEMNRIESILKYQMSDLEMAYTELSVVDNELKNLEEKKKDLENNVAEAKSNMDEVLEAMNTLKSNNDAKETKIFAKFCKSIGVNSIHEYEEGKKSYDERISEFDQQIGRIKDQLSYEYNSDTNINVERWETNLNKTRNELESIVEHENNMKSLLDEATRELETVHAEHRNFVNFIENTKKKVLPLRDEIAAMARKHMSLTDTLNQKQHMIEEKRAHYHALITEAKVSGFSMIAVDHQTPSSQTETSDSLSQTYEREASLEIDFSILPKELRDLEDAEIQKTRETLEKIITDQREELDVIIDPNLQASQQLELAQEKLAETNQKLEVNRRNIKDTNAAFDIVKNERFNQFSQFFDHVSNRVDVIYKQLTGHQAAQAYLIAENPEEPYLAGIHYNCVVPEKRFQINEHLSGGEKTMAALPLLFAMQDVDGKQPPFQILDEIDAALDHSNARKVVNYIKQHRENQSIVISHKKEILAGADVIIGITSTGSDLRLESKVLTFDLRPYAERTTRS